MIGYAPSKSLKPGMRVQMTETGHRAITPAEGNPVWTVLFAYPDRFGGKAGTKVEFANGVANIFPAGANWIVM